MKTKLFSTLLLLVSLSVIPFSVNSTEASPKPQKPIDWQYVDGVRMKDGVLYYDKNSVTLEGTSNTGKIFDSANLLFVYNSPHTVKMADGTEKTALSRISIVMIECTKGDMVTLFDYWFDTEFPIVGQKPIAIFEYKPTEADADSFPLHTPIHEILCPIYA